MTRIPPRCVAFRDPSIRLALASLAMLAPARSAAAQDLDVDGFVKAEYLHDTRQSVAARDGEFLLYPLPDGEGSETDNLAGVAFFSRVGLGVSGLPDALGAEVTGRLEADFFGSTNETVSTLRLRRAFARMAWDDVELLFGQEWSPLFTVAAYPRTVATSTGAPFQPFARQPQVRLTLTPGHLRVIAVAAWQRDAFAEIAFDPDADPETENAVAGVEQQQRAALPAGHLHVQYVTERGTVGAGVYGKALRPVATGERFYAGTVQGYAAYTAPGVEVRGKATYGGDLADHLMTGGYVYAPESAAAGPAYERDAFQPLTLLAGWVDVNGTGRVAPGLFVGYLANLGARDEIETPRALVNATATRSPSIDYIWRVAPRVALNAGAMRLALEVEATTALYASGFDEHFRPVRQGNDDSVTNVRSNVSVFLFF